MAILQKVSHGEPNWDGKVNAIIDAVNTQETAISNLKPSEVTSEGLVFQNGFSLRSGGYQTISLPDGGKIVSLKLQMKLNADSALDNLAAVTVPAEFKNGLAYRYGNAGWGTTWSTDQYGIITIGKIAGFTGKLGGGENSFYFVSTEFIV